MGSEEIEKDAKSSSGLVKVIARVAFSHLGLCVIVILYCVMGGLLFELLEKENEIAACIEARNEYDEMENETLFSLLDIVMNNPLLSTASNAQLNGVFESFRNNSISIGYDGSWCEGYGTESGPTHEWTFAGGLFFSMTVITTIGYGHIAPKTVWGRILCISYAMMGIPLMLMFLANIGEVLADIFRYVYAKIICCGCFKERKKRNHPLHVNGSDSNSGAYVGPAIASPSSINLGTTDNFRASSIMANEPTTDLQQTTRKRGFAHGMSDNVMSREPSVLGSKGFNFENTTAPGETAMPSRMSRTPSLTTGVQRRNINNAPHIKQLGNEDIKQRSNQLTRLKSTNSQEALIVDDDSDYDDDDEEWDELSKVSVPLTVSLGILTLYIIGGAVLFRYWEEWDMLQSSYFCFITLSTIGFGDVTPGRDFHDPTTNARLIIGTIYGIFGMAILSMCFALMQEEMVEKFRWIGKRFGVVDEFDDVDEELDNIASVGVQQNSRNQSDC